MHYIFLISFGTTKIFKFQNYYSNSHFLKEIIMITKTYHIITIDITQIIDSPLNLNLSFLILKWTEMDYTKWTEVDRIDQIESNRIGPIWTERDWMHQINKNEDWMDRLDRSRLNCTILIEVDRSGLNVPNWTEWIEVNWLGLNKT